MHHMQLISDNLMGRYFCRDSAEHQEALRKNRPRITKNDAKLPEVVGEVIAALSVIRVWPHLHNVFR